MEGERLHAECVGDVLPVGRPAHPVRRAGFLLQPADLGIGPQPGRHDGGPLEVRGLVGIARGAEERGEALAIRGPVEGHHVHAGSGHRRGLPAREVDDVQGSGLPLPLPADGASAGPLRQLLRVGEGEGGREGHAAPVGGEGEGLRRQRAGVEDAGLTAPEPEEVDPGLPVLLPQESERGAVRRPDRPRRRIGREGELARLTAGRRDHPDLGGDGPPGLEIGISGLGGIEVGRWLRPGVEGPGANRVGHTGAVRGEGDAGGLGEGDQVEGAGAHRCARSRSRHLGGEDRGRSEQEGEDGRGAQVHGRAS